MAKPSKLDGSGSDSPQRQDYKKTAGKASIVTAAKKGKGLNSGSMNLFQMGRKSK
jgi:hypothetical protein